MADNGNDTTNKLARLNQQVAYALLTTVAGYYGASQIGLIKPTPLPTEPRVSAQTLETARVNSEMLIHNRLKIDELHSGQAPRIGLVPRWYQIHEDFEGLREDIGELKQSVDRNTTERRRNTSALEGLSMEIEDRRHRAPQSVSAPVDDDIFSPLPPSKPEPASWWDWMVARFRS